MDFFAGLPGTRHPRLSAQGLQKTGGKGEGGQQAEVTASLQPDGEVLTPPFCCAPSFISREPGAQPTPEERGSEAVSASRRGHPAGSHHAERTVSYG